MREEISDAIWRLSRRKTQLVCILSHIYQGIIPRIYVGSLSNITIYVNLIYNNCFGVLKLKGVKPGCKP